MDAINELKGDVRNREANPSGWYLNQINAVSFNGCQICTREEFNQCVKECSDNFGQTKSPIYTQAMSDAGELPSVGMECLFKHGGKMIKGCVVAVTERFIILIDDEGIERVRIILESTFESLTPPIELIDGERYEFELSFGDYRVGYYKKERNSFFDGMLCANKICGKSEASNIQLLEVKS